MVSKGLISSIDAAWHGCIAMSVRSEAEARARQGLQASSWRNGAVPDSPTVPSSPLIAAKNTIGQVGRVMLSTGL